MKPNFRNFSSIVIVVLLILAGCSKSDPAPSLIGSWNATTTIRSGCKVSTDNGTTTCPSSCTSVFTATTITTGTQVSTYTTDGNSLTVKSSGTSSSTTVYTYTLTSTTLIITNTDTTTGCTRVTTLTRV